MQTDFLAEHQWSAVIFPRASCAQVTKSWPCTMIMLRSHWTSTSAAPPAAFWVFELRSWFVKGIRGSFPCCRNHPSVAWNILKPGFCTADFIHVAVGFCCVFDLFCRRCACPTPKPFAFVYFLDLPTLLDPGTWDGGNVVYYGLATSAEGQAVEAVLRRGWGVFHAGLELHKATPISQGRRHNLILWCRSSGVRNEARRRTGVTAEYSGHLMEEFSQKPRAIIQRE